MRSRNHGKLCGVKEGGGGRKRTGIVQVMACELREGEGVPHDCLAHLSLVSSHLHFSNTFTGGKVLEDRAECVWRKRSRMGNKETEVMVNWFLRVAAHAERSWFPSCGPSARKEGSVSAFLVLSQSAEQWDSMSTDHTDSRCSNRHYLEWELFRNMLSDITVVSRAEKFSFELAPSNHVTISRTSHLSGTTDRHRMDRCVQPYNWWQSTISQFRTILYLLAWE